MSLTASYSPRVGGGGFSYGKSPALFATYRVKVLNDSVNCCIARMWVILYHVISFYHFYVFLKLFFSIFFDIVVSAGLDSCCWIFWISLWAAFAAVVGSWCSCFFFAAFFNPKNLEREIEKTWRIFLVLVEDLKETAKKIEHLLLILHEETAGHRLLQEPGFAWKFER